MVKSSEQDTNRDSKGRFLKGKTGNPGGRPDYVGQLDKALKAVEKEKRESFLKRFVEMAWSNPQVMIALAKKILPDKIEGQSRGDKIIIIRPEPNERVTIKDVPG